jgi:polyhydroxyalkanoate synthase subunit PhaE
MTDFRNFGNNNPLELGKQFWETWTDFAQQQAGKASAGGASPGMPNWHEGLELWSRLTGTSPSTDANHAVEQLTRHGQRMMQMMQSLATQVASGKPLNPADLAGNWKEMFGGGNPMLDTLGEISGSGARGWEQFTQSIEPVLAGLRGERNEILGMPAFGSGRERQERLQALLAAQVEHAETSAAYAALLAKASQDGMALFQDKLAERSEPGRQIDSARALYDLWVDAAEEAYSKEALSPDFRAAYGAMVNAQMRLKQRLHQEIDRQVGELGLPTRAELDGAHRKIHAMQRELRELRGLLRQMASAGGQAAASAVRSAPAKTARSAKASKQVANKSAKPASTHAAADAGGKAPSKRASKPASKRAAKRS